MKSNGNGLKIDDMPLLVGMAYKYYLRGFTAKETAKMMDVSERTVRRWAVGYDFERNAKPTPFGERVAELRKKGLSYATIAQRLKCCKTTVYNHVRKNRQGIG